MAYDPMAIAQQIMANREQRQQQSLVPMVPESPTLPDRPVYRAPVEQEFSWDVPVAERPQGTEDWIWTRSRWAKENFDREQAQRAQEAQQQYAMDLGAWQDATNLLQKQYERDLAMSRDYYQQQGLVAPMPGDISPAIRQLGQSWQGTTDPALRQKYNQAAIQMAIDAGWVQPGFSGSVNSLPQMTQAGAPTYERQYKEQALKDDATRWEWEKDLKERQYADALKQQAFENSLATQKVNMSGARTSGTKKPTESDRKRQVSQQAIGWINTNKGKFRGKYPAKNMYEQVKRNIAAGTMDQELGYAVMKQLETLYMK